MSRPARPVLAGWVLGLLALVLAACTGTDAEQARICRLTLPALNPDAAGFSILRVRPGTGPREVRIDYRITRAGRPEQTRFVICRFAAVGLSAGKADLQALSTERGPVTGASLYLMKRYYLETPDALAADPGIAAIEGALPELSPGTAYALQQGLAGLPKIAIYGLLAAAYALVFGLVGRINFAFGEIAAIGAAGMTVGVGLILPILPGGSVAGLSVGLVLCLFAAGLHGVAGGHLAIGRVRGRQASLIATVGLSLALMEYLRLTQGSGRYWLPPLWNGPLPIARAGEFLVTVTPMGLATTGLGLLAASGLLWLVAATTYGRDWRAYADDPGAAALVGVDGRRLLVTTLAVASGLAGFAAFLTVLHYGAFGYADGFVLGIKALIAAVIGGIGSVPGALVGGLLVGLFEAGWSAALPIEGRDIALYAALVAVLVLRPGGLMGWAAGGPRAV